MASCLRVRVVPSSILLLLLLPVVPIAAQDLLPACLDKLAADRRFEPLAGKLALGANAKVAPALLAETSLATDKERPLILNWAAARAECLKASSRFGNDVYRPPLQAFSISTAMSRRLRYATICSATPSCGPSSAAAAAAWPTVDTPAVAWP